MTLREMSEMIEKRKADDRGSSRQSLPWKDSWEPVISSWGINHQRVNGSKRIPNSQDFLRFTATDRRRERAFDRLLQETRQIGNSEKTNSRE